MATLNIVRLDAIHSPGLHFPPDFNHTYSEWPMTPPTNEAVIERLKEADVVITTRIPITKEVLEACPKLKLVAAMAIGTDMVDLPACSAHNVIVTNVPAASNESVAEHAIALFFALRRNIVGMHDITRGGEEWVKRYSLKDEFGFLPGTCREEVVGILGGGELGNRVSTICRALGMKVHLSERKGISTLRPGRISFQETIKKSSILFVTLPLTPETTSLLSTPEFLLMRPDAVIINVARGGIIDEDALVRAIEEKRIMGAATDVFWEEPAGSGNSVLVRKAREWSERVEGGLNGRLVLSPHVAWWARASIERLRKTVCGNIEAWGRGHVVNQVL